MIRILLLRGMLAGVVACLLVFASARWIGEPQVKRAIAFETNLDQAQRELPEPEIVTRRMQKSRVAALEMQMLLWAVLGFLFGWLADRLGSRAPSFRTFPERQHS
jgi:predicted cobalt transporter CbtA